MDENEARTKRITWRFTAGAQMTRLSDLSTAQIRLMAKLDDGFQHEDSVGCELEEIKGREHTTMLTLVNLGLVELVPGRGMQFWFRLTEKGRKVREEGEA